MTDFICRCGHKKDKHSNLGEYDMACIARFMRVTECFCDGYVPDNLKYLENLADET